MIDDLCERDSFSKLLFAHPNKFDVSYEINPYMDTSVDVGNYEKDWLNCVRKLRKHAKVNTVDYHTYETEGKNITDLPDSVFVANHGFGIPGSNDIILSNMENKERSDEVKYFEKFCYHNDYNTKHISKDYSFEGGGDAKWHPKKDLLWLSYGFRTDYEALSEIDTMLDSKTIKLELVNPKYYHLDVCFKPLSVSDVLIIPDAFSTRSLEMIKDIFDNVYNVPNDEKDDFACNCVTLPNNKVAIDKHNTETINLLENKGYKTVKVNTKEFTKAGGSIDCLTIKLP